MPDSIIKADNISSLSGGGIGFPDGSVSNPSMKFTNDGDTGLYRIGSNTIGIASNGSKVGEIGNGYGGFTGNVIQAVSFIQDSLVTTTSSSWQTTNLIGTITPKYSSSKILIFASTCGYSGAASASWTYFTLIRGTVISGVVSGVDLGAVNNKGFTYIGDNSGGSSVSLVTIVYLDSPNTTSSQTYTMAFRNSSGSLTYAQADNNRGTMNLLEIQQ